MSAPDEGERNAWEVRAGYGDEVIWDEVQDARRAAQLSELLCSPVLKAEAEPLEEKRGEAA